MWYKAGKVALTTGSKTVTGTGTHFTENVLRGYVFYGPDKQAYEVDRIVGARELTLATPYEGATATARPYGIWQTQGNIVELSSHAAQILAKYQILDEQVSATADNAADAEVSKEAAAASASLAGEHAAGAQVHRDAAAQSVTEANAASAAAQAASNDAAASERAAASSETQAAQSAASALQSEQAADAAAAAGQQSANNAIAAQDVAQASAEAASTNQQAAAGSQAAALASQGAAAVSATAAQGSEQAAGGSAHAAATSAGEATAQAGASAASAVAAEAARQRAVTAASEAVNARDVAVQSAASTQAALGTVLDAQVNADWHADSGKAQILNKPNLESKQDALGYKPPQAVGGWLNSVIVDDSRAKYYAPRDRDMGIYFDFRNNDAGNLHDGGVQHGAITFRQWGAGDDFSGGPAHQLGFTANGNVFHRTGKEAAWEKYQRLLHAGQNGTLHDNGAPHIDDLNHPPMGWCIYTQEKTANRPSAYGQVLTTSLTGNAIAGNGNWIMQEAFSTDNGAFRRANIGDSGWTAWVRTWDNGNFDPASARVDYANSAGSAGSAYTAQQAEKISNGHSYMQFQWSDPGGQTGYVWGSDSTGSARLSQTSNLSVGNARTWNGVAMRYQENPTDQQPYYVLAVFAGGGAEATLVNRTALAVGSAVTAVYAHQLTGQGLVHGGIGGHHFNKDHTQPGLPGVWESRGSVYDNGSGTDGNVGTRIAFWQRIR